MKEHIVLNGVVVMGLGEGAYFMSMPHYRNEIKKRLGFEAYPGTLNLKVKKKEIDLLKEVNAVRVEGYKHGNKIFGGVSCYKARIKNINGAIIIPDINKHKEGIVEFIAPVHLRSELKLEGGDKVEVKLLRKIKNTLIN